MILRLYYLAGMIFFITANTAVAQPDMGVIINNNDGILFPDSAFPGLKAQLDEALKKQDRLTAARCLQQMGRICLHLNHISQALDYHLQADKLFATTGQDLWRAENLNEIGTVFLRNKQREPARQYYEEALAIFQQRKDIPGMASTRSKIGHWFIAQHKPDSGFYYQRLALQNYKGLKDSAGIAKIYNHLGNIYEDQHQYDSAFFYFQRSLKLSEAVHDTIAIIDAINNVGDVYRKTNRYAQSLAMTRRAIAMALDARQLFHVGLMYRDLAKTYHLVGQNDSAFFYQKAFMQSLQEVSSRESSAQLIVLKTLYEVEKKNIEIASLKAARRTQLAIVAIVLLLLICGALIISRQRLRIKNEVLQSKEQQAAHQAEQVKGELLQQALKQELELKSRELSTHTLNIIQKNQFLEKIQQQLDEILKDPRRDQRRALRQLQLQINQNISNGQHWDDFQGIFDQVHDAFFVRLKAYCDSLTRTDLRFIALLKMNLGSEEMATLLGISPDSVRVMRHRLRKKLNLGQGQGLEQFIQSI